MPIPMPDDRISKSLYEQDLDAWAMSQAATLRAVARAIGRGEAWPADLPRSIDWDNLAEEIEGFARKDRRELGSRLALIVEHLAKLEFSRSAGPRAGWSETVLRERAQIASILRDSPSLCGLLPDILADRMQGAIEIATRSLKLHGETAAAATVVLARSGAGYGLDEILGSWLPDRPEP